MAAAEENRLPEDELIAQMSCVLPDLRCAFQPARADLASHRTLIFAAMDTTSNALSITLSLLCEYQDVQEKLRAEILEASGGEDLDYDALVALPYLDAVCRETLRL